MLFSAFIIGFLCEVVEIDYGHCGPNLTFVWNSLKGLAKVIHPNVFTILWDKLTKLTDMQAKNFPQAIPRRNRGSES